MLKKNLYINEVDGLRAIAVLSVIFFHFDFYFEDFWLFKGGFIGVDIFFVISGFVITYTALKDYDKGKFSIINFYKKRAKRILPIFFTVTFFTLIFSYLIYFPDFLAEVGRSTLFSLFFISNFFFHYKNKIYGEEETGFIPNLHTWSLSVEEQFYIFFPIIFLIFFKFFKKKFFLIIFLVFLIFFIFGMYTSYYHTSFNFYMILSRAWQLLLGVMVAYAVYTDKINIKKKNAELICSISLVILLISVFFLFDVNNSNPNLITLLPLLSTALIIIFCNKSNIAKIILANFFLQNIGKVSYSLYMWHFPIIALWKANFYQISSFNEKILIFLIIIFFSIVGYFLIEKKVRYSDDKSFRKFILTGLIFLILLTSISYLLTKKNINLKKYPKIENYEFNNQKLLKERTDFVNKHYITPTEFGLNSKKKVLFIGNSFGQDILISLNFSQKINQDFDLRIYRTQIECLLENLKMKKLNCLMIGGNYKNNKINILNYKRAEIIVLSTKWSNKDVKKLKDIIEILKEDKKEIIIIGQKPFWKISFSGTLLDILIYKNYKFEKDIINRSPQIYYNKISKISKFYNEKLENISKKNSISFLDPFKLFCEIENKTCPVLTDNKKKIYWDYGHSTIEGLKYFSKIIDKLNWFNLN